MSYRYDDKPFNPEDHLRKFDVRNGSKMRLAFGCYYATNGHDPKVHDFLGWPAPDRPDDVCQISPIHRFNWWRPLYPRPEIPLKLEPIHLTEEGYTTCEVKLEDPDMEAHMIVNASIDEDTDNIIRMNVYAGFPTFSDEPKKARFTLFVSKTENMDDTIDAVCHGEIVILPGAPYSEVM